MPNVLTLLLPRRLSVLLTAALLPVVLSCKKRDDPPAAETNITRASKIVVDERCLVVIGSSVNLLMRRIRPESDRCRPLDLVHLFFAELDF